MYRRGVLSVALMLAALVGSPVRAGGPSGAREHALRELLTRILAEPDAAARHTLAATAPAVAGDAPFADVVAAVRKGPLLPPGAPKARKVAGKVETLTVVGSVTVGWSFEHKGDVYRYAVDVPKGYDPAKPVGLLLDPGHGTGKGAPDEEKAGFLGMWRRFADESGHADWLVARTEIIEQIGVDGVRGALPEDEVAQVFDAFFRDLFTRFAVDPDRIVVTGLSQTGFWAWYLGVFRSDRFSGIAPMSAMTWHVNAFAGNLVSLPVHVLQGSADTICPAVQPRATCALLARLGSDVRYVEIAGAAHEYSVWSKLPDGLRSLGERPRVRYPKRISKSVRNTLGPWVSWIRIDAIDEEGAGKAGVKPTAGVDAEISGQTIRVYSEHVAALTVCLSSEMLDLSQPVDIVWNGKPLDRDPKELVKPSLVTLFELAGEKADWSVTFAATVKLRR